MRRKGRALEAIVPSLHALLLAAGCLLTGYSDREKGDTGVRQYGAFNNICSFLPQQLAKVQSTAASRTKGRKVPFKVGCTYFATFMLLEPCNIGSDWHACLLNEASAICVVQGVLTNNFK